VAVNGAVDASEIKSHLS